MPETINNDQSFRDLENIFSEYAKAADNATEILQKGADEFVKDLKMLPAPRSRISKPGYTHMIDLFASREERGNILVGWGKYYGPIVEGGSNRMAARPHFKPLFSRNKEKYYNLMIKEFHGGI